MVKKRRLSGLAGLVALPAGISSAGADQAMTDPIKTIVDKFSQCAVDNEEDAAQLDGSLNHAVDWGPVAAK
jgi:hypothetical protein